MYIALKIKQASNQTNLKMVILVFLTLGIALFGSLFWYLSHRIEESTKADFAKRNVRFIAQPNAFFQILKKERSEFIRLEQVKKEGKVFGFYFIGSPTILVTEPEIAQLVMSKEFTNFSNRRVRF